MGTRPPRRKATHDHLPSRSPLAKARDDWFESAEGQRATDPEILIGRSYASYLKNRLEQAFMAGAEWAESQRLKKRAK